jgi:hypothetical protein
MRTSSFFYASSILKERKSNLVHSDCTKTNNVGISPFVTSCKIQLTLLVCTTLPTVIMRAVRKLTALLGFLVTASNGFAPNSAGFRFHKAANGRAAPSPFALGLSSWGSSWGDADQDRYEDAFQHNTMRTDLRMFLTQRALQSFIFLSVSCRDPHTVKWLEVRASNIEVQKCGERNRTARLRRIVQTNHSSYLYCCHCSYPQDNYRFGNLEEFHGTGGLNLTEFTSWDSILVDMLDRPADVVVVSARRRGRGHGGWSKNNPYMEDVRTRIRLFFLC